MNYECLIKTQATEHAMVYIDIIMNYTFYVCVWYINTVLVLEAYKYI
jgi:hypothetical protein